MTHLFAWLKKLRAKTKITPEQADNIRFPCC
jgi:hypothetical protein